MTTHKMGRHVFGTVYAPQLPAKTLMEYMGITKFSVVQRYINFSKTEKVEQFERPTRNIVESNATVPTAAITADGISLVERLKTLAPRGQEGAWGAFIEGLMGLLKPSKTEVQEVLGD